MKEWGLSYWFFIRPPSSFEHLLVCSVDPGWKTAPTACWFQSRNIDIIIYLSGFAHAASYYVCQVSVWFFIGTFFA